MSQQPDVRCRTFAARQGIETIGRSVAAARASAERRCGPSEPQLSGSASRNVPGSPLEDACILARLSSTVTVLKAKGPSAWEPWGLGAANLAATTCRTESAQRGSGRLLRKIG